MRGVFRCVRGAALFPYNDVAIGSILAGRYHSTLAPGKGLNRISQIGEQISNVEVAKFSFGTCTGPMNYNSLLMARKSVNTPFLSCVLNRRSFVTMLSNNLLSHTTSITRGAMLHRQNFLPLGPPFMYQSPSSSSLLSAQPFQQTVRNMNRNARRPKKANHGKRPVSHARRREKAKRIKSRAYKEKIFGFW